MSVEPWRHVLRSGVFAATRPDGSLFVSDAALAALAGALRDDSPQLVQDRTVFTLPLPRSSDGSIPILGACLIGYCGWKGEGLNDPNGVDEFFAEVCAAVDRRLGLEASVTLTQWYDETHRPEAFAQLRVEVARERERRGAAGKLGAVAALTPGTA